MRIGDLLPNRRVEAWRYSDLRAALRDAAPKLSSDHEHIIARLAGAVRRSEVPAGAPVLQVDRIEAAEPFAARAQEIEAPAGGDLTRIVLQSGDGVALDVARVRLGEGAVFRQFVLAEGARFARIETHVEVGGGGASVMLNGVYLAGVSRHADLTSVITHAAAGSTTAQLIKGAARRGGRGVFQGKIIVARDAQNTDARQGHHALLLEDGAEIDAKPELEIYADAVSCAHGNTIGGLDAGQLFYLQSRGVPQAQARALLTEAFLAEATPDWLPEEQREEVFARIRAWLEAGP